MTNYEKLRSKSVSELAEWFAEQFEYEYTPWDRWFNENYCSDCEPVIARLFEDNSEHECSFCEVNGDTCRYFPSKDILLDLPLLIETWLKSEEASE